jgi:hypothetical protein
MRDLSHLDLPNVSEGTYSVLITRKSTKKTQHHTFHKPTFAIFHNKLNLLFNWSLEVAHITIPSLHNGRDVTSVTMAPIYKQKPCGFRGHNLLSRAWTKRGLIYVIYVLYIYELQTYHAIICKSDKPNAQCYNWATLFLGEINTGTWHSRLVESQK